jgi:hypothetical protein
MFRGLLLAGEGLFFLTLLAVDRSQIGQGIRMTWIRLQDLFIQGLGLFDFSLTVMGKGLGEARVVRLIQMLCFGLRVCIRKSCSWRGWR